MVKTKQNRIEVRGLSDSEVMYLKSLAKDQKAKSFNEFLLKVCREKIEKGKMNQAEKVYLAHLENMDLTSEHVLLQMEKQTELLTDFLEKMESYSSHISRWLEYEGEVESDG